MTKTKECPITRIRRSLYPCNNLKDVIEVCPEKLPNYEDKIKIFFEEHLHTDEGILYCLTGSGSITALHWVQTNYIKAMRLFAGDPVRTPFNHPHDHLPARKDYLQAFVHKEAGGHAIDATA